MVIMKRNESTMGRSKDQSRSLPSNKQSGMTPFVYAPKEFPEDASTQIIETTEGRNKLKSKMRILNGDEVPEQLMIWLSFSDCMIYGLKPS